MDNFSIYQASPDPENMSEHEFMIHKQALQQDVKDYLEIDDQIKALNKAIKERKDKKKALSEEILGTMKKFEINNMNTKNGKLIYAVSKSKKGLNTKTLIKGLNLYFKDEMKATEVGKIVMNSREVVEKVSLRRTIHKNKNI